MESKIMVHGTGDFINDYDPQIKTVTHTNQIDGKWGSFCVGTNLSTTWSDDYGKFTSAEKDFVKILDLGYIVRTINNNALYIKVEGSRDINVDLYAINITRDFNLKFNGLEIGRRYSIAELKEMMHELS